MARFFHQISSNLSKSPYVRGFSYFRSLSPQPYNDALVINRRSIFNGATMSMFSKSFQMANACKNPINIVQTDNQHRKRNTRSRQYYRDEKEEDEDDDDARQEYEKKLQKYYAERERKLYIRNYKQYLQNYDFPNQSAKLNLKNKAQSVANENINSKVLNFLQAKRENFRISKPRVDYIAEDAERKYNQSQPILERFGTTRYFKPYKVERTRSRTDRGLYGTSERDAFSELYNAVTKSLQPASLGAFGFIQPSMEQERNKRIKVISQPKYELKTAERSEPKPKKSSRNPKSTKPNKRDYATGEQLLKSEEIFEQKQNYIDTRKFDNVSLDNIDTRAFRKNSVNQNMYNYNPSSLESELQETKKIIKKFNDLYSDYDSPSELIGKLNETANIRPTNNLTNEMEGGRHNSVRYDPLNESNYLYNRIKSLHSSNLYKEHSSNTEPLKDDIASKLDLQPDRTSSYNDGITSNSYNSSEKLLVPWPSLSEKIQYMLDEHDTYSNSHKKCVTAKSSRNRDFNKEDQSLEGHQIPIQQWRYFCTKSTHGILGPEATVMPKLKKLPKILIKSPQRKDCPQPEDSCDVKRSDEGMKIQMKKLPTLVPGECGCKEDPPMDEGKPLQRLKSKHIPDVVWHCRDKAEVCNLSSRADASLVVKRKTLPKIVASDCNAAEEIKLIDGPNLKPLNLKFPDVVRICDFRVCDDCCPQRADDSLKLVKRSLPTLKPKDCPSCKPEIMGDVVLKRLKPFHIPEPVRICIEKVEKCDDMIRADNNLITMKKSLPPFKPQNCPCVEDDDNMTAPMLPRLKKVKIPEPKREPCDKKKIDCPERSDRGMKIESKTLPYMKPADCPCIENEPLPLGKPIRRLKVKVIHPDPIRDCRTSIDRCPPRADDGLKIIRKELPNMIAGDYDMLPPAVADVPPLKRMNLTIPDIPRICEPEVVEICPPRADDTIVIKRRNLPIIKPGNCPCVEDEPLIDIPLPRLKPFIIPEKDKCLLVDTQQCIIPRADSTLKVTKKELPVFSPQKCPEKKEDMNMTAPKLQRLKKVFIPEPKKPCRDKPCETAVRADGIIRVSLRRLPQLKPSNCPCVEDKPMSKPIPLKRLSLRHVVDEPRICPEKQEACPPRADDGLKVRHKILPRLKVGDYEPQMDNLEPGKPLSRLKYIPIKEPERICIEKLEKCPDRADKDMIITKRTLPFIKGSDCCIEDSIIQEEGIPLKMPKKTHIPEPPKRINCEAKKDECPPRADDILMYEPKKKMLKSLLPSSNHKESNDSNNHLNKNTRKYSTDSNVVTTNTNLLLQKPLKNQNMQSTRVYSTINNKIPGTKMVRLKRLKIRPDFDPTCPTNTDKCIDDCAKPEAKPIRMDDLLGYDGHKKKILPTMRPSKCPCVEDHVEMSDIRLRGPYVRPGYVPYEGRSCNVPICVTNRPYRSDTISKYEVRKKKLPVVIPRPRRYSTFTGSNLLTDIHTVLINNTKFLQTTAALFKKKTTQKNKKKECKKLGDSKKKKHCIKIKMAHCPPRARTSCAEFHVPKEQCEKQQAPYPAYSDCQVDEKVAKPTECESIPYYLQPNQPILSSINIITPPPPEHARIDTTREEECLRKKLNLSDDTHTQDCGNFSEKEKPSDLEKLRSMVADSEASGQPESANTLCDVPPKLEVCLPESEKKAKEEKVKEEETECEVPPEKAKTVEMATSCETEKGLVNQEMIACVQKSQLTLDSQEESSLWNKISTYFKAKSDSTDGCNQIEKDLCPTSKESTKVSMSDECLQGISTMKTDLAPPPTLEPLSTEIAQPMLKELPKNILECTKTEDKPKIDTKAKGTMDEKQNVECKTESPNSKGADSKSSGVKKSSAQLCKGQKPLKGCLPRARQSCVDAKLPEKPCETKEPPFPAFSELYNKFRKLTSNECTRQKIEAKKRQINHDYEKADKDKSNGKGSERKYSTMANLRRSYSTKAPKTPHDLLKYFKQIQDNKSANVDDAELANNILNIIKVGIEVLKESKLIDPEDPCLDIINQLDITSIPELQNIIMNDLNNNLLTNMPSKTSTSKTTSLLQEDNKLVIDTIQQFCRNVCDVHEFNILEYEESERRKTKQVQDFLDNILKNNRKD